MYSLTKPQQSIYSMEKFSGSSVSVICGSMLIKTSKTVSEMTKAVQEIYRLNDALRIRLTEQKGHTLQYIADYQQQDITVLQFNTKEELDSYSTAFTKVPFDLSASLCDIRVIILPEKAGILVKLHHLVGDAWTIALIGTHFQKLLNHEIVEVFSYTDFIQTEKAYLESTKYQKDKTYFLTQKDYCDTPTYLSNKNTESLQAKRKSFTLTTEKLLTFARQNNTSAFNIFMTILAIYMNRTHMNIENFFLGTTILNRSNIKEKNTMGMFVNTVPFLIQLKNDDSFLQNQKSMQYRFLDILRHQRYNYNDLLQETGTSEKLFDILFSYQNAQILGDSVETTWYPCGMQNESLQIHIDDRDNKGIFCIHYDYQVDKFTEYDILQLHEQLCTLLFDAITNPDTPICKLKLLTNKQQKNILYDFNHTKFHYSISDTATIYNLFEKNARQNLSKTAITVSGTHITYNELLSLSQLLDEKIQSVTQGKKSIIAIIAERSIEMYIAIYGTIRGGNAYLPISPDYPKERIDYILKDSAATIVLVQDNFIKNISHTACLNMTDFINTALEDVKNYTNSSIFDTITHTNLTLSSAQPEDTAYVIYTSGSTGTPKGARISHKSAINRILWMQEAYPLEENSVILQKTPYTFDVSVWEIFWWGMCGGSLATSKPEEHFLPAKILEEVANNQVTHLHFVPSVFDVFLTYLEQHKEECDKFHSVQHIFLSGEALNAELITRFYALFSYENQKLHNLYGPTECAIDVTYYDCIPKENIPVPIGKPIYNTQIYILDTYLNPMPIGIVGELCIGGINVGQGYLNKPELTADKFIHNPFETGMLYRTGDFAYFRQDGQIIFIGRMDSQIKWNGQRIELTEIENTIRSISGIDSVAVIIKKNGEKNILAAFYCGTNISPQEIRSHCEKNLPRYMVPTAIVPLKQMPLNSSGKLDKRALSLEQISLLETNSWEAPINEREKEICDLFSKVLGEKNIHRNSNFFDLGGTSLTMISFLSEYRFQNISASDFISNPTPAMLATFTEKNEFHFIKILKDFPDAKKALILIPYAGGGAEAFSKFVNTFASSTKEYSIYYIDYLHSYEECAKACQELYFLSASKNLYLYSHCAGSAVAMQIINILEAEHKKIIKHYISGGFIPFTKTGEKYIEKNNKKNPWNSIPDQALKIILTKAGASFKDFSKERIHEILTRFRRDTDFLTQYFSQDISPIQCPVSSIISKKDIFTYNYKKAHKLWKRHTTNFYKIHFIDTTSHYFQADNCTAFIKILRSILEE